MESNERYMLRGVSASKEDVHNAIKNIDKGLYPKAFCKIIPDILGGDPEYCNIMHADGAGTKSSLAYAYWKETGDLSVWKGIAQDALIMNIDDLLCVGAVDNILVSSTIGRNKNLVPGSVISAIINGTDELLADIEKETVELKEGTGWFKIPEEGYVRGWGGSPDDLSHFGFDMYPGGNLNSQGWHVMVSGTPVGDSLDGKILIGTINTSGQFSSL